MDLSEHLYGTTSVGSVFELTPDQSGASYVFKVLYSFCGGECAAPQTLPSGLVSDRSGSLYGTTFFLGANHCGSVFELTPNSTRTEWTETDLYSFRCGFGNPVVGLATDASGNLYGIASDTVFELIRHPADNTYSDRVLYTFCPAGFRGCSDVNPRGGLVFDGGGNLYGTTVAGGLSGETATYGGTVFALKR